MLEELPELRSTRRLLASHTAHITHLHAKLQAYRGRPSMAERCAELEWELVLFEAMRADARAILAAHREVARVARLAAARAARAAAGAKPRPWLQASRRAANKALKAELTALLAA